MGEKAAQDWTHTHPHTLTGQATSLTPAPSQCAARCLRMLLQGVLPTVHTKACFLKRKQ